jgi:hypothetical protein
MYLLQVKLPPKRKYPKGEIVNILFDDNVCLAIAKAWCRVKWNLPEGIEFKVMYDQDCYVINSYRV